jgi:predicted small lipoprotein YifL
MKTHCAKLSTLLLVACTTAACGQRGPLTLPGDPSSVQSEIPSLPTPDENDEEDDERDHEPG